ncbi:hypothetical protein B0H14DRAFT_2636384 [Mycena olivaceomarginata]|nr:hypothetical protein B0H14DRAFT_2636384 [Mycena olivaceomarginata]
MVFLLVCKASPRDSGTLACILDRSPVTLGRATVTCGGGQMKMPSWREAVSQSMVTVSLDNKWSIPKVHPDVVRPPEPIYESYSAVDHSEEDDYNDDEGNAKDDPLRQWTEDHCEIDLIEMLRLEGRSDYTEAMTCSRCLRGTAHHCCITCMGGGELLCDSFTVATHLQLPFHTIQRWTGSWFEHRAFKDMGLQIQLKHWGSDAACPVPQPAPGDDFVIVYTLGVHPVHLDYCNCGQGRHHTVQLLQAWLWPVTTMNPRTAATFSCWNFTRVWREGNDNLHYKKEKYHKFLRMTRQWRNIQMLKRAGRGHDPSGVLGTKEGECALLCPACPSPERICHQTGKIYWRENNANFRLKRKDILLEEKDPGLGNGRAFYCEVLAYMQHRSHCVAHDTVDKPDHEARGTVSSGIGAVNCAHHNMKQPLLVGYLQLGKQRMGKHEWVNANPLAKSTKEMGLGFQRDTLDNHFNDWNHNKIIGLGYTMRRKVEKAMGLGCSLAAQDNEA